MHLGPIHEPTEENPEFALEQYGRALKLIRENRKYEAVRALRRVLEYDPDFPEARLKLDELLENSGGSR